MNTANAAFFHKYERIERKYKEIVKSTYECEVKNVDFKNTIPTTKIINNWVKEKTNDKIPGFLDEEELDPKTKFMLGEISPTITYTSYLIYNLQSVIIKETKRGCVRSVILFCLSHSTSKITDKKDR